jgi:hypothetical protein
MLGQTARKGIATPAGDDPPISFVVNESCDTQAARCSNNNARYERVT